MNESDYVAWIHELVRQGVYSNTLGEDFIRQRRLFEDVYRDRIVAGRMRGAVGCVGGIPVEAASARELVGLADQQYSGRALYFESMPELG